MFCSEPAVLSVLVARIVSPGSLTVEVDEAGTKMNRTRDGLGVSLALQHSFSHSKRDR